MVGNKKRLYVAIYPSGVTNNEERKFHWGFLVGPKQEEKNDVVPGKRYHVKNPLGVWVYEELEVNNVKFSINLLARVLVGKIEDLDRFENIVRNAPIIQGDPNWRCRSWVKDVLSRLVADGKALGTSQLDWEKIEAQGRSYVAQKTAAGRYNVISSTRPTYSMLEGREVIP